MAELNLLTRYVSVALRFRVTYSDAVPARFISLVSILVKL